MASSDLNPSNEAYRLPSRQKHQGAKGFQGMQLIEKELGNSINNKKIEVPMYRMEMLRKMR